MAGTQQTSLIDRVYVPSILYQMERSQNRRIDDRGLRTAQLLVEDPLLIPGVSEDRPDLTFSPVIVAEYHLPNSHPALRCCYCQSRTSHWNGFVVQFRPEKLHLIGSVCGPTQFNLQFGLAKRAHKDLLDRQGFLRRLDSIIARAPVVVEACNDLLRSAELQRVESASSSLLSIQTDAMMRLRSLARNDGMLFENVRVRGSQTERRQLGKLMGLGILEAQSLRMDIFALKRHLANFPSAAKIDTDSRTNRQLRAILTATESLYSAALSAIHTINDAPNFFVQINLDRIVSWALTATTDKLSFDDKNFVIRSYSGRVNVERLLQYEPLPALPPLHVD